MFATASVEIAQPLVQLSYRISRAQQAAAAGDHSAVAAELELAQAHCRGGDAPASGSARRRGSFGRQAARRRLERLMVGKLCAAPAKGGAASGLIEYLVGYAISEKGATRREIADALDGVYAESEQRPDLGVDAVWRPEAGGGTRPSSILVRNCASFSTASLEIDADGARNPGIRSSAMHFVWSWNERESGLANR